MHLAANVELQLISGGRFAGDVGVGVCKMDLAEGFHTRVAKQAQSL